MRHGEGPEGMDMRKLCFDGGGGLMEEDMLEFQLFPKEVTSRWGT